jgi:hypothetical protein
VLRIQRRHILIDPAVQGSLARRVILHWACFLFVASVLSFVLQVLANPFLPLANHVANLWWTQGPFLFVIAILLPAFIVDAITTSHRFAGPVLNLRRAMREIAAGKPARMLSFRDGDFWKELADDYNDLLQRAGAAPHDGISPDQKRNAPGLDDPLVATTK